MKVTGKNGLGDILKKVLQIFFFGGIIILLGLPFTVYAVGLNLNASAYVIYPNGIVLLIIVYKFIQLFDSLKNNDPFCDNNVKILRFTGIVSLVGSILWLLDLLYEIILARLYDMISIITLVFLSALFFGVFIALYILAELLKQAGEYKKENELTI